MANVIRKLKDADATSLLRLSFDKKLRYSWRKCIISSPTLITELSAKFEFEDIILDKKPKGDLPYKFKNLLIVSPKILERVGQLKNSRAGILATLSIPLPLSIESFDAKSMLILDGIEDLGELGTLIRSACAFGCKSVWITHTCGDPFDPICIRASQGALFTNMPYRVGSIDNAIKHCRQTTNITKLQLAHTSASIRLGISEASLSESQMSFSGDFCLLVQKNRSDHAIGDFKPIHLSNIENPRILPISMAASGLLYVLNSRYLVSS